MGGFSERGRLLGFVLLICGVATRLAGYDPADGRSGADACRECGRNCLDGMLLHSLSCVAKKLRGGMAALFCDTPHGSAAILKCIRNDVGRSRSLASRFVNLYAYFFQH
jgi:thymidine phosphorylase